MKLYSLNELAADEQTCLKAMAVHSEMNMNIFLSMPVVIAKDVSFTTVSEVIGRSNERCDW